MVTRDVSWCSSLIRDGRHLFKVSHLPSSRCETFHCKGGIRIATDVYLLSERFRITLCCMYFLSCQLEGNDFTLGCHGTQSCVVPEIIFLLSSRSRLPQPSLQPTQTSCPHRRPRDFPLLQPSFHLEGPFLAVLSGFALFRPMIEET